MLANTVAYMRRELHNFEHVDGQLFLRGYVPWGKIGQRSQHDVAMGEK